ncbi:MAG: histone deacetylase [Desulfobacterales bacterium]|jgi:acetoin utilization deacetylase AcuC-like enzyme
MSGEKNVIAAPLRPTTGIVRNLAFLDHRTTNGHPENQGRLEAVYRMLDQTDRLRRLVLVEARLAEEDEILLVHSAAHLATVAATASRESTALTPDTIASAGSYRAARLAVGGVLEAVSRVADGRLANAFALVRPPGHHAERNRAMGYCLFNNVAIAAAYAREVLGMDRVMILDWDVHHGNGTQHIFEQDDRVLFVSIHQFPHFPGTGSFTDTGIGRGEGYSVNIPITKGYGDGEYAAILQALLMPITAAFKPDLILVSAGFDPHASDPHGGMRLTPTGFAALTRSLLESAAACCDGRVVLVLEGGYDVDTIGDSVKAVLDELSGATKSAVAEIAATANPKKVNYALKRVVNVQRRYWKNLSRPMKVDCSGRTVHI